MTVSMPRSALPAGFLPDSTVESIGRGSLVETGLIRAAFASNDRHDEHPTRKSPGISVLCSQWENPTDSPRWGAATHAWVG